jgi:hypothetical protein
MENQENQSRVLSLAGVSFTKENPLREFESLPGYQGLL